MKKRNKKYNPIKHLANDAKTDLKNKCVVNIIGVTSGSISYDYKLRKPYDVSIKSAAMYAAIKHNWAVNCAVFLRHKNMEEEFLSEWYSTPFPCTQLEIGQSLHDNHMGLINEAKERYPKNICGVGWIAVPRGVVLSDRICHEVFREFGAFEYGAEWESKQQ